MVLARGASRDGGAGCYGTQLTVKMDSTQTGQQVHACNDLTGMRSDSIESTACMHRMQNFS